MKKSILHIASLLLAAVGLAACDDDKAMPPVPVPGADQVIPEVNTSILELKQAFYKPTEFSYSTLVGEKPDGSHYIIAGKIVSSDEAGNIYKNIMIEDATAGLTVAVDKTKLYQEYKIGQTLVIDATGLYVGGYGNCMQLGGEPQSTEKPQPSRCDEDIFTAQSWVYGLPETVAPQVVTIPEIDAARNTPDEFIALQSRFVEFQNVEFENAGEPLAVQGSSTSRYAFDEQGNRVQLYNSGQSTIWMNSLPSGKGNVSGILSFYNREWQLLIIDMDSFQGFTGGTAPKEAIMTESFGSGVGTFTIEDENLGGGSYVWSFASNYSCMKASGFFSGADHDTSSRLVSPEIDLSGYTSVTASYEQACNYFASLEAAKQEAAFEVSTDGGTTWEAQAVPNLNDYASWNFKSSGSIDLSKFAGKKIRVAFHYTSTSAKAGTWEVKNLKVLGTK